MIAAGIDSPRMIVRWMPGRSTARFSALRTRTSLNGFLPLTLEPASSSENWSMPMKMVRTSWPSSTFRLVFWRSRATSWVGRSVTMSTSPDSSAATRVASALIGE